MRDGGRREVALVSPKFRRTGCGCGARAAFGGTCFGSCAELGPPLVSRAACQITIEGMWEKGGGGEGGRGVWTNQHIHDRCLLRKIQENHHANITGVCFLTPWLLCLLLSSGLPVGVRRGGSGFGGAGGLLCIFMLAPPFHSPEQSFLCKCHPKVSPGLGLSPRWV